MKATSRQGPGWSQVERRVTVDNDTKRVVADEVVAEITDPFVRFDRPVDLLTILHYDGELLAREVILRGGEQNRHGGLEDAQWRLTTPVEQTWLKEVLGQSIAYMTPGVWVSNEELGRKRI